MPKLPKIYMDFYQNQGPAILDNTEYYGKISIEVSGTHPLKANEEMVELDTEMGKGFPR